MESGKIWISSQVFRRACDFYEKILGKYFIYSKKSWLISVSLDPFEFKSLKPMVYPCVVLRFLAQTISCRWCCSLTAHQTDPFMFWIFLEILHSKCNTISTVSTICGRRIYPCFNSTSKLGHNFSQYAATVRCCFQVQM